MKYRTLGRTGLTVSEIGLGMEHLDMTDPATTVEAIRLALARGINFFDLLLGPTDASAAVMGEAFGGLDGLLQRGDSDAGAAKRKAAAEVRREVESRIEPPQFVQPQLLDDPLTIGRPLEGVVVDHDDPVIPRRVDVEFDRIGTRFDSMPDRSDGVLRGGARTAPVPDHESGLCG